MLYSRVQYYCSTCYNLTPCVLRTVSSVSELITFVSQVCIQTIYILLLTRTLILTLLYITTHSLWLLLHSLLISYYFFYSFTLYSYFFNSFILYNLSFLYNSSSLVYILVQDQTSLIVLILSTLNSPVLLSLLYILYSSFTLLT